MEWTSNHFLVTARPVSQWELACSISNFSMVGLTDCRISNTPIQKTRKGRLLYP
jgi:hypothetical protein